MLLILVMVLCVVGYAVARAMKKDRQRPESVTLPNGKVAIFFEAGDRNPFGLINMANACPIAAVNSDHQCSGDCRTAIVSAASKKDEGNIMLDPKTGRLTIDSGPVTFTEAQVRMDESRNQIIVHLTTSHLINPEEANAYSDIMGLTRIPVIINVWCPDLWKFTLPKTEAPGRVEIAFGDSCVVISTNRGTAEVVQKSAGPSPLREIEISSVLERDAIPVHETTGRTD